MDASEFVGSEGDQYRSALNSDMRPHLDTTAQAWSKVHGALHSYSYTLERLQRRMATVAATASQQQTTLQHAQGRLHHSKIKDFQHLTMASGGTPTEGGTQDTYHSHTARYASEVSTAQRALQGTIDAANRIHAEHDEAVRACCHLIDEAKHLRFVKPPGWFSRGLHAVGHWVKAHSGQLLQISAILKQISGITGMLALLPIPGFQEVMAGISLGTGAAALIIDVAVKLATGKGSWAQIGIDALSLIPGAKALREGQTISRGVKIARAVQTYAPKVGITGLTAYQATQGDASWRDVVLAGAGISQNKKLGIVMGYANAANATYDFAKNPHRKWTDYGDLIVALGSAETGRRGNMHDIREQQAADTRNEQHNEPPPERWTQPDTEAARNATDRYVQRAMDSINRQVDRNMGSINRVLDRQDRAAMVAANHAEQFARQHGDSFTNAAHATGRQMERVSHSTGAIFDRQANSASRLFSHMDEAAKNIPTPSMS